MHLPIAYFDFEIPYPLINKLISLLYIFARQIELPHVLKKNGVCYFLSQSKLLGFIFSPGENKNLNQDSFPFKINFTVRYWMDTVCGGGPTYKRTWKKCAWGEKPTISWVFVGYLVVEFGHVAASTTPRYDISTETVLFDGSFRVFRSSHVQHFPKTVLQFYHCPLQGERVIERAHETRNLLLQRFIHSFLFWLHHILSKMIFPEFHNMFIHYYLLKKGA